MKPSTGPASPRRGRTWNIYVGDRTNRGIQVFDPDGTFVREMKIDVPIPPDARPATGNMPTPEKRGQPEWRAFPGRIYKLTLRPAGTTTTASRH